MSFLWHGLTEQGAQVPVQVDAQGRVIAIDATPETNYWERTGTTLRPKNLDDVVLTERWFQAGANTGSSAGAQGATLWAGDTGSNKHAVLAIYNNQLTSDSITISSSPDSATVKTVRFAVGTDGGVTIGPDVGSGATTNIIFDANGEATFKGNVFAPNITLRSTDSQFYAKTGQYSGPELDLLVEIERLEALVKHLYDKLRLTPPAGWEVWDGDTDLIKSRGRRPHQ